MDFKTRLFGGDGWKFPTSGRHYKRVLWREALQKLAGVSCELHGTHLGVKECFCEKNWRAGDFFRTRGKSEEDIYVFCRHEFWMERSIFHINLLRFDWNMKFPPASHVTLLHVFFLPL